MKRTNVELEILFKELDGRIAKVNRARKEAGLRAVARAEVKLLGQMSLLANKKVSLLLSLAQTADMDALLTMDHVLKEELKACLRKHGMVRSLLLLVRLRYSRNYLVELCGFWWLPLLIKE